MIPGIGRDNVFVLVEVCVRACVRACVGGDLDLTPLTCLLQVPVSAFSPPHVLSGWKVCTLLTFVIINYIIHRHLCV